MKGYPRHDEDTEEEYFYVVILILLSFFGLFYMSLFSNEMAYAKQGLLILSIMGLLLSIITGFSSLGDWKVFKRSFFNWSNFYEKNSIILTLVYLMSLASLVFIVDFQSATADGFRIGTVVVVSFVQLVRTLFFNKSQ